MSHIAVVLFLLLLCTTTTTTTIASAMRVGGILRSDLTDEHPNPLQPANPVIGIITTPYSYCSQDIPPPKGFKARSCVDGYYNQWLESQGVRMMAIPWDAPFTESKKPLLEGLNGVLFPGGSVAGDDFENYVRNASEIVDYAKRTPGFFIWGTCMGFQVLSVVFASRDTNILECDYTGVDPAMLSLNFTAAQPDSIMFGKNAVSPINIVDMLKQYPTTLNFHKCGISPKDFYNKISPHGDVVLLSTNEDTSGKAFISSWEHQKLNIFATQFHPERPPSEYAHDIINHSPSTLAVSTYLATFIRQRLQQNNHSFSDQETVNKKTLDNYPKVYYGWGSSQYWLDI